MKREHGSFTNLTSDDDASDIIWDEIEHAARSDTRVLITGQTDIGKDALATIIHRMSPRRRGPFAMLNCAGVPESLLEAKLFGHARGTYSGAHLDEVGLLELAANGTLFLDEVGEMPLRLQGALFTFLETGEVQRAGADRAHLRVDIRLITGTSRDLGSKLSFGAFRQDLYYRLNVIRVQMPRFVTRQWPSSHWSAQMTANRQGL